MVETKNNLMRNYELKIKEAFPFNPLFNFNFADINFTNIKSRKFKDYLAEIGVTSYLSQIKKETNKFYTSKEIDQLEDILSDLYEEFISFNYSSKRDKIKSFEFYFKFVICLNLCNSETDYYKDLKKQYVNKLINLSKDNNDNEDESELDPYRLLLLLSFLITQQLDFLYTVFLFNIMFNEKERNDIMKSIDENKGTYTGGVTIYSFVHNKIKELVKDFYVDVIQTRIIKELTEFLDSNNKLVFKEYINDSNSSYEMIGYLIFTLDQKAYKNILRLPESTDISGDEEDEEDSDFEEDEVESDNDDLNLIKFQKKISKIDLNDPDNSGFYKSFLEGLVEYDFRENILRKSLEFEIIS